jgi:transposase-like protein
MARVEVITRPERRRRWSAEQKRAIVAESLAPGAPFSVLNLDILFAVVPAGFLAKCLWLARVCAISAGLGVVYGVADLIENPEWGVCDFS